MAASAGQLYNDPASRPSPLTATKTPAWSLVCLALLCLVAFGYMSFISLTEWKAGMWHLSDVGTIQSVLVNTWGGNFMYSAQDNGNFLAFHFSPFLFLLMPFIWLSDYPIPLVLSYQLALSLTPIPLFYLARNFNLSPLVGLGLGVWFLGNHFVGSLQLSNHFESWYVLFALATMVLFPRRYTAAFWVCAVLTLSVKEDCSAWMLAFAIWQWVFYRQDPLIRIRSIKFALLCLLWGMVAGSVMLLTSAQQASSAAKYVNRMGGISFGLDTVSMLVVLIATSGGLALLNWKTALLLLIPLPVILGNFPITRNLQYYYSYPFLPFLALATVAGTATLVRWVAHRGDTPIGRFQAGLAVFLMVFCAVQFPVTTRTNDLRRFPHNPSPRDLKRLEVAATELPADAPVALQYGLWGVVPWRYDTVFLIDHELEDHHYVFMDERSPHGYGEAEFNTIADRLQTDLASGRRHEVYSNYGFMIISPVGNPDSSEEVNGN